MLVRKEKKKKKNKGVTELSGSAFSKFSHYLRSDIIASHFLGLANASPSTPSLPTLLSQIPSAYPPSSANSQISLKITCSVT